MLKKGVCKYKQRTNHTVPETINTSSLTQDRLSCHFETSDVSYRHGHE